MNTNLYNSDGTLSAQAQLLLSPKPTDMSMGEWIKLRKKFKSQLSAEDSIEFDKAKKRASAKAWEQKNQEKHSKYLKAYHKAYYKKNKKEMELFYKSYRESQDKEKRRAYMTEYAKTRRQKDPLYNFFHSIRSQAVRVVKQVGLGKKPTNTFKWVGCSPEQLKAHIESLFLEGMTWDNYGKYGWHVDHIRPVSSFKPEEWEQINHYTNLQPLWWQDNLSKSDN